MLVGDDSVICSHSFIAAGTMIGQRCFIGHGVMFCNDKHPVANNPDWKCLPPTVGDEASIGSGAVILPGVCIGHKAMVGAGTTVTRDVLPHATVYGIW